MISDTIDDFVEQIRQWAMRTVADQRVDCIEFIVGAELVASWQRPKSEPEEFPVPE